MNLSIHGIDIQSGEGHSTMEHTANVTTSCHHRQQESGLARIGRFVWHLVEMVIAMQLGMALFHALLCARLSPYPLLHEVVMDFYMAVPMVAVMVWHGHCWRHSAEMVGAMLAGPAVFIACRLLNVSAHLPWLSTQTLSTLASATMYLGMLAAMLYRRTDYA